MFKSCGQRFVNRDTDVWIVLQTESYVGKTYSHNQNCSRKVNIDDLSKALLLLIILTIF